MANAMIAVAFTVFLTQSPVAKDVEAQRVRPVSDVYDRMQERRRQDEASERWRQYEQDKKRSLDLFRQQQEEERARKSMEEDLRIFVPDPRR
jgi:flagellar biosynthesis protein FliP